MSTPLTVCKYLRQYFGEASVMGASTIVVVVPCNCDAPVFKVNVIGDLAVMTPLCDIHHWRDRQRRSFTLDEHLGARIIRYLRTPLSVTAVPTEAELDAVEDIAAYAAKLEPVSDLTERLWASVRDEFAARGHAIAAVGRSCVTVGDTCVSVLVSNGNSVSVLWGDHHAVYAASDPDALAELRSDLEAYSQA